ncbi:MAG: flavodoxin family protein [Chloroflexota bacterium]
MKAVVIYWSKTGNTEKAAGAIRAGLEAGGAEVELRTVEEAGNTDYFDYDLVCVGFPSYQWSPPEAVVRWLKERHRRYAREGLVRVNAPPVAGKHALIFCTYSGPHTGIDEAVPAGKYAAQFFEHLGIRVVDEWYVVGEFHGREEASTLGCLGDIRGRPTEKDLRRIEERTRSLVRRLGGGRRR